MRKIKKIKEWLLFILLTIISVLFIAFLKRKPDWIEEKQKEIDNRKQEINENVKKVKESRADCKKKADKLNNDLKETDKNFYNRFFSILIICFLILTPVVLAEENLPMNKNDLKIPVTYEKLLENYYDMFEYTIHYRDLAYNYKEIYEAEKVNGDILLQEIDNLKMLVDMQKDMIDQLMGRKFDVSAGINIVPLNLKNTGILLSVGYQF